MSDESRTSWEETQKAWDRVGSQFGDVRRRVGEHYRRLEKQGDEDVARTRQSVNDAVQSVVRQLDQAFTSVGNALRDPDAKDDLGRAIRSFGDALTATFSDLSGQVRQQFGSKSGGADAGGADAGRSSGPPA